MNDKDTNQCQEAASIEMPRYKCHKEVWALKIGEILQAPADQERRYSGGDWYLVPEDSRYARIMVGHDGYYAKHKPQVGGYYVTSYSPAAPFEAGYALTEPTALQLGAAARAAGPAGSYEK